MSETVHIHNRVDSGLKPASSHFADGTLVCKCHDALVKVKIEGSIHYNYVCGCTKCWKPAGASFSVVAVVPRANLIASENGQKLHIVNPSAALRLRRVRRAPLRPDRKHQAAVLCFRLHPSRAVHRTRLAAAGIRRIRFVRHRIGGQSGTDGRYPWPTQGTQPRALRLPVTGADGRHRHAHRHGLRRPGSPIGTRPVALGATGGANPGS